MFVSTENSIPQAGSRNQGDARYRSIVGWMSFSSAGVDAVVVVAVWLYVVYQLTVLVITRWRRSEVIYPVESEVR